MHTSLICVVLGHGGRLKAPRADRWLWQLYSIVVELPELQITADYQAGCSSTLSLCFSCCLFCDHTHFYFIFYLQRTSPETKCHWLHYLYLLTANCLCDLFSIFFLVLMFISSWQLQWIILLLHNLSRRSSLSDGNRKREHVIHIPSVWWINTLILLRLNLPLPSDITAS